MRTLIALCLSLLCSCSAVETHDEASDSPRATVEVRAVWTIEDTELLIGDLACTLICHDPQAVFRRRTEPGEPLLFSDLAPGTYEVTVAGKTREFTTGEFDLHAGKRTVVQIDLVTAKGKADRREILSEIGSLLTAPARLVIRVFDSTDPVEREDSEEFHLNEKPSNNRF